MDEVLYGNLRINAKKFIAYEGKVKRNDVGPDGKKGWSVQPLCPDCGATVHLYVPRKMAEAFKAAGKETGQEVNKTLTTGTKKSSTRPHFDHDDHKAKAECPSSFTQQPHLATLYAANTFDFRERARNEAVLLDPFVVRKNQQTLLKLMEELTGVSTISKEDQQALDRIAKAKLFTMVGLAEHPWFLPVLQVLFLGAHDRKAKTSGRTFKAAYSIGDLETLDITYRGAALRPDGTKPTLGVPKSLYVYFSNKHGRLQGPWRRYKGGPPITVDVMSLRPSNHMQLSPQYVALGDKAVIPEKSLPAPQPVAEVVREAPALAVVAARDTKPAEVRPEAEVFTLTPQQVTISPPKRTISTGRRFKRTHAHPRQRPLF